MSDRPSAREVARVIGANSGSSEEVQIEYIIWMLEEMAGGYRGAIDRSFFLKREERAYFLEKAARIIQDVRKRSMI